MMIIGWSVGLGWVVLRWLGYVGLGCDFSPSGLVWCGGVVWCLKRERGAGERERRMYVCMYTRF